MKYTNSKDGIERATFKIEVRLTRKEVSRLQDFLKAEYKGSKVTRTVRDLLSSAAGDGIYSLWEKVEDTEAEAHRS